MVYFIVEGPFDVNSVYVLDTVWVFIHLCVDCTFEGRTSKYTWFSHSAIATGCVIAHTTANEWDS